MKSAATIVLLLLLALGCSRAAVLQSLRQSHVQAWQNYIITRENSGNINSAIIIDNSGGITLAHSDNYDLIAGEPPFSALSSTILFTRVGGASLWPATSS